MSTAGKVLSVLSVVMLVVQLALFSAVAELNMSGGGRLDALRKDVAKLRVDVAQAERSSYDLREAVSAEQVARERDLFVSRARLSTAERQLTTTRESLTRVQFQVENTTKAVASAVEAKTLRNQEKADLETRKAEEEAIVKRLQGENTLLLESLTSLRSSFQETLKKNAEEVRRQSGSAATRPATRPASFVR